MTESPDRECPVDGCSQRFLSAQGVGSHLMLAHEASDRWSSEPDLSETITYSDGNSTVIQSEEDPDAWIESTLSLDEMGLEVLDDA